MKQTETPIPVVQFGDLMSRATDRLTYEVVFDFVAAEPAACGACPKDVFYHVRVTDDLLQLEDRFGLVLI